MAALNQTFDATTVAPSTGGFEVIPAGDYLAQIVNSEMKPTRDNTGQFLWMEIDIIDGQYAGKKLFDRLNLVNANQQTVDIAQRTLSALCHATGKLQVSDSEMLHYIPIMVTVKVRPAGPDKSGVHRDAQSEVRGYKAANGSRPAVTAPRALTAPVAVAAKPVAVTPPWRRAG